MRYLIISGIAAACSCATGAIATGGGIVRTGPPEAAIAATVSLPADARLIYVSGTVPDAIKANAP